MRMHEAHVLCVNTYICNTNTHQCNCMLCVCIYTHVWVNVQIDVSRERKHTYGPNLKTGILKIFQSVHLITASF